jgi:putative nucleotidyltransferase with HDIG domain
MVGDLVPLLTSAGSLTQKMRLVAHRLSVGAAYDLVAFTLFGTEGPAHVTYSGGAYRWQGVAPAVTRSATRTVVFNDLDDVDDPGDWASLRSDGMRSALVAPMMWQGEPVGAITVACRRPDVFGAADAAFLMSVATHVTAIVRMARLVDQLSEATASLEEARAETVMMLAVAAEAHDRSTGMHLQTIRALAEGLARELGYGAADVAALGLAAILHDIGKLSVPDAVLSSADKLDEGEWEQMKQHTIWGAAFLGSRPGFTLAASVARSHHERWDGAGYPDRLAGDDIPEEAAIVTVADSFDAMTHDRPYKAGRSTGDAIEEVRRCSGTQFSPRVVDALLRLYERGQLPHAACADDANEPAAA